jgi:predicted signal transduction protein with EAL and GGDEF domain
VETLMRNADLALYRAKDSGGGMHCNYEPALHAHAEERRQLEFALRRALERNELHLTYQPVVTPRASNWSASRRCCAGTAPSTAWSVRPSSFRWPRTRG